MSQFLNMMLPATVLIVAINSGLAAEEFDDKNAAVQLRRPSAMANLPELELLLVGNRDTGTVTMVDTKSLSVIGEHKCGESIVALRAIDSSNVFALDQNTHQLIRLRVSKPDLDVIERIEVPKFPSEVEFIPEHAQLWITSKWSKKLTCFDLNDLDHPSQPFSLELAYEPGVLTSFSGPDGKSYLVVADAFGGNLSVIECRTGMCHTRPTAMHNIRGLTQFGADLVVSGQELNSLARSNFDDIHWGNMISNQLAVIKSERLLDASQPLLGRMRQILLGEPENAAGDPGDLMVLNDGRLAVALEGVGEIAVFDRGHWLAPKRIAVDSRPIELASGEGRIFVANQLADSISVVNSKQHTVETQIVLSDHTKAELTLQQRGEKLFFDSRLSLEGWMSCHSCHTDGHAAPGLNDNLSDGGFGAPKRILSLFHVGETGPWAWNGRTKALREQIIRSVESTMQGKSLPPEDADALEAFITKIAVPRNDGSNPNEIANTDEVEAGGNLFASLNCVNCHKPPTFTIDGVFDVGVEDERGNREFNPPTLLANSTRRAFFHDGRAKSLEEVLMKYQHQLGNRRLSETELQCLLKYLRTL